MVKRRKGWRPRGLVHPRTRAGGVAATQRAFPCKGECSYNRIHGPFSRGQTYYFTMPLKPMKARARMPTLMMAMGTPLKALGTSFRARCSRMPAKITMARP